MANPNQQARSAHGKYVRTPETAKRDAQAAQLRAEGWTYDAIAGELGYSDRSTCRQAIHRALREIVEEPAEEVRRLELERLDGELHRLNGIEAAVREVLKRHHVTVSNGQIVHLDGEPLLDDAPVLQAADRLLKIEEQRRKNGESRRKLLGLDAPSRVSVEAETLGREIGRLLDAALGPDDGDNADA